MLNRSTAERIQYWIFADRIPGVKILMVTNGLTFIAVALSAHARKALSYLTFDSRSVLSEPWTVVTYPIVSGCAGSIICILFSIYWLWVAGGSLERTWGTTRFIRYMLSMSSISAGGLYLGAMLSGTGISAVGLWLPLAGITVAFAMLNPEQQILFFFVIPLKLKYLALLDVIIVLVSYGSTSLLLGVCALAGCAYSYWKVKPGIFRLPEREGGQVIRVIDRSKRRGSLNPLRRLREQKERERLRRLLEGSDDRDND